MATELSAFFPDLVAISVFVIKVFETRISIVIDPPAVGPRLSQSNTAD